MSSSRQILSKSDRRVNVIHVMIVDSLVVKEDPLSLVSSSSPRGYERSSSAVGVVLPEELSWS